MKILHHNVFKYVKTLIITVIIALTTAICVFAGKTNSDEQISAQVYYSNVQIERGDTLWSLAEKYKPQQSSCKDYIKSIKQLNSLSGDILYIGSYLIVPMYIN